ncbi:Rz1-like lysis system protein LysC [Laribacter hongkongensis]|nr:Rz1-like lysis system protein LysC [Laribacter hongkongensis]
MPTCVCGLIPACLLTLGACSSVPPSPAPVITVSGCPGVTPCRLPDSRPQTNRDLLNELARTEAAWHACAAQVDLIHRCQQELNR